MSRYVESPERPSVIAQPSLFLAGGITGTADWQSDMVAALADLPWTILNPRRANFPIHDPAAAYAQIAWEHDMLRKALAILFWFPPETLCPIVLYELGAWSMAAKPILVGTHPDYQRRQDVVIQTGLVRPEVEVASSFDALVAQARDLMAKVPIPC